MGTVWGLSALIDFHNYFWGGRGEGVEGGRGGVVGTLFEPSAVSFHGERVLAWWGGVLLMEYACRPAGQLFNNKPA